MLCIKHALIRQVVYGEHRFRRMAARRQIRRGQTGMPVVRMHHIRAPEWVKAAGHFTSGPAKQRKTQDVIGISEQVGVVIRATGTVVKMRRVNQVNTHAVEMPEKQRDTSSEGIATRHDLCIGNAATNIWKRREQHAGIHAVRNLRGR